MLEKNSKQNYSKIKSYKDLLNLPKNLMIKLPTSYDVIGDIVIIKLSSELQEYKTEIGSALLKSKKNIRTVCLAQPVKGELRIRDLDIIAGEKNTETLHKEFGLKFKVDIKKTYFSPRLATERKHISSLVKPGEIVIDLFTGVAPFSIMIARYSNPKIIYAIDKNTDSIIYAKKNIALNNVLDKIELIEGDAKNIIKKFKSEGVKADRIIMNLPFSAFSFFNDILDITSNKGTIHLYDIINENNIKEKEINIYQVGENKGVEITDLNFRKIKTYAPREFYMGIDITAKKMPM